MHTPPILLYLITVVFSYMELIRILVICVTHAIYIKTINLE